MHASDAYPEDLMTARQIEDEYGVPGQVLRKWASRWRIARYPGRWRRHGTMYARQHVQPLAEQYKAVPQRAPKRAA